MSGPVTPAFVQQIQDLINVWNTHQSQLGAWLGGTMNGGPNEDGRYPLVDALGRETLIPSPAAFSDMVYGPANVAELAKVAAELARESAEGSANRSNDQRILAEAARGAAIDARNLAQEHRNHAGTHEANARYWAELAQGSGQSSSEDREIVEQLAAETADNAALAAQDASDAAASAALAATFNPALFDRKADLLSADRITGVLSVDRIPVLPSQRQFASSGGLANLTTAQQNEIGQGSIVTTTDGFRYVYTGFGSKTLAASYVVLADTTPEWSSISGRPSEFIPAAHTQDWSTITGKPNLAATDGTSINLGAWANGMAAQVNGSAWRYLPSLDHVNSLLANYFRTDQVTVITGGRSGAEGGEFHLARPASATNLSGNIAIDINGDSLRIFENAAPFRGIVVNLAAQGSQSNIWTSADFDPASKADVGGANTFTANQTFRGLIPVRVQQSASTGAGFIDLAGVSANSSGSVVFRDAAGVRPGYIGNANATTLNIVSDVATIALNRRPTFAGNLAWDAGNFDPAAKLFNTAGIWVGSSDGAERFFFSTNGRTYIRGDGVEFRSRTDGISCVIEGNGNVHATGNFYAGVDQWFRVRGSGGIVFETHGGGWHMTDTTWVRSYAGRGVYTGGQMRADSGFYVGSARQPVFTISQAAPSGGVDGDVHIVW